jgi:plasmid replication initiation protein
VDGRTYEQLRSALNRLERTRLESSGAYQLWSDRSERPFEGTFTILSSVTIERRRLTDRNQLALFSALSASEPGDARVVVSPQLRANIAAGNTISLSLQHYGSLSNPVARRLYRLLATARSQDHITWRISLGALASQLPLTQRYPSHLQRVLQPAHEMLIAAGLLRDASFHQLDREWHVDYVLATRNTIAP